MINPIHLESYSFFGLQKGPSLLILGSIHGDEICGTKAIESINELLAQKKIVISSGNLTMIPISNPLAANLNTRNGERNLNRNFYPKDDPKDFEDHINNVLCPIINTHDIILDLHSFRKGKKPFALIKSISNDHSIELILSNKKTRLYEKTLASWLGVKTVVGNWTDTYVKGVNRRKQEQKINKDFFNAVNLDSKYGVGTTEYSREHGAIAVTLECGQHLDPLSQTTAFNSILSILNQLGMLKNSNIKFEEKNINFVTLFEVFDKHDIDDHLLFAWENFDQIDKGSEIAKRSNGEKILAKYDGYILFPNNDARLGQEWFYLAK